MTLRPMTINAATVVALMLSACSAHQAQTTSGAEYLARYQPVQAAADPVIQRKTARTDAEAEIVEATIHTLSTDDLVRRAAAIEPLLTFPARIGLARIERGSLTTVPAAEAAQWMAMAARYPALGRITAIDPFVARYAAATVLPTERRALRRDAHDVITRIRLGAARQHMDAVMIYEVGVRNISGPDFAGLARVRVLGDVPLPAKEIKNEGVARAFLMDVRNGYPYGVASASLDLEPFERGFFDEGPLNDQFVDVKAGITRALLPNVEAMLDDLVRATRMRLASAQ